MAVEISLKKLHTDVYTALKTWHKTDTNDSPLAYLHLFRDFRQNAKIGGNPRRATNRLIFQALEVLEADNAKEAKLLRTRFLDGAKMHIVANQLNLAEPTVYRMQRQAIQHLAEALYRMELQARDAYRSSLEKRLNLPPAIHLIGVEEHRKRLLDVLSHPDTPWLVSIEGLGGIGKTALAADLVRQPDLHNHFQDIAWVSTKQEELLPGIGIKPVNRPALNVDTLIESLLEQLGNNASLSLSIRQKKEILNRLLKQTPYLIVVDNLETALDYQALLPDLQRLANPSKFLLTSRHSLRAYSDVFCLGLEELNLIDAIRFIRYEAEARGIPLLTDAPEDHLARIYEVVGGNPLALKLVIGQVSLFPLSQVLDNLQQAKGKRADELYTYIYWQIWETLEPVSQQVLLLMPLAQDGAMEQLLAVSKLQADTLYEALQQLINLSLVQVKGDLENRTYTIHRLTETFLLNEAIKWQTSS